MKYLVLCLALFSLTSCTYAQDYDYTVICLHQGSEQLERIDSDEIDKAWTSQHGTLVNFKNGKVIEYSVAVDCKIIKTPK